MRTRLFLLGVLALLLCAGADTIPSSPGVDVAKKGGSTPFPPDHFGAYTAMRGGIGGHPPDHYGSRLYAHGGEHADWFPHGRRLAALGTPRDWPPSNPGGHSMNC